MMIYAGIDEAGYGPMFGPLLVGRAVLALDRLSPADATPNVWDHLSVAVCRELTGRKGRIAVNDSKKLHTPASGLKHLELGVLSFASLADMHPATVDVLLDLLGERAHHQLDHLPWYAASEECPWDDVPGHITEGELAVARSMLAVNAKASEVRVLDMGAAVVFEDKFNHMVKHTRSKAATSFTFVAGHLQSIWQKFGRHEPVVVVDRQSGRMRYRELLATTFEGATLRILDESPQVSAYHIEQKSGDAKRAMTVRFEVEADAEHMPVALASMVSKYTRELLMQRFNNWFTTKCPQIKPTAGYATDAKRFWREIEPMLGKLAIEPGMLRRMS